MFLLTAPNPSCLLNSRIDIAYGDGHLRHGAACEHAEKDSIMTWSLLVGRVSLLIMLCGGLTASGALAATAAGTETQAALPVSKIVLYASGVGYFQRDGQVDGRAEVTLRFKTDDVNDLLKSMVVQDLDGGQVRAVTYDSRDPLARVLKSFAVDLTANPGLGDLLRQIRGASVVVAAPEPVRGVILGVEKKREPAGEGEVVEVEYLNLLTDTGLRALPLAQLQRIELVSERLDAELRQALEVLASGHDTQKKTVRLIFEGAGQRRVRVGYVIATPVWKTSYRLVLSEDSTPFLQGWALVENTADDDWHDVRLSLVSGRPISFVMDLYEPLYIERPEVEPELYASLRPQVYEQAVGEAPQEAVHPQPGRQGAAPPKSPRARRFEAGKIAPMAPMAAAPAAAARSTMRLQQGVESAAQATELGELFEYAITAPVSLARQKSAMLPIVNQEVAGTKLSIYNERVHAKHPLNGVRLHNSTALHLMQGPVTVFDGGSYAGDARLPDLPAGQEVLISYAMDLDTEVVPDRADEHQELVSASLRKGTLLLTQKARREKTYTVTNRGQKPKKLLIEYPIQPGWELIAPAKPSERTRDAYRFALMVGAGKTAKLTVREERPIQQTVRLLDVGLDRIEYYLRAKQISPEVQQALQRVVSLRHELDRISVERNRHEEQIRTVAQEQARIRDNMARLPQNSSLYNRYVRKLDQQETEIENARQEIARLEEAEAQQRRKLEDYLLSLELD